MDVAVGVLDRDAWGRNTDNLAVVRTAARTVVSIPRDLWCRTHEDRVNRAFGLGGASLLTRALAEHGFAVDAVVCLRRGAVERALEGVSVTVPVAHRMLFLYPLAPTALLEEGAKQIRFEPPSERLCGERIHQWLGARRVPRGGGTDLDRIARQQLLVRALLDQGFDFSRCLLDPSRVSVSDERALAALAEVRSAWSWQVHDAVRPATIEGMQVLVPAHPVVAKAWQAGRRLRDWLRSLG